MGSYGGKLISFLKKKSFIFLKRSLELHFKMKDFLSLLFHNKVKKWSYNLSSYTDSVMWDATYFSTKYKFSSTAHMKHSVVRILYIKDN